MIEGVERLREGECILCEHREFERPDDLLRPLRRDGRRRGHEATRARGSPLAPSSSPVEHITKRVQQSRLSSGRRAAGASERCCSPGQPRTGCTVQLSCSKLKRLFEIECDDLAARELDHEVAHRGDRNHPRDPLPVLGAELGVARADLGARRIESACRADRRP